MEESTNISTSDTVFRTKQEPVAEPAIESRETPGLVEGETDLPKTQDQIDRLDVWETENKRDYFQDILGIRETAHIFPVKAQYKFVDKFLKAEMQERGWDMTIENYNTLLDEYETEIGSKNMERYKRIQRMFQYFKTVKKYREIKKLRDSYSVNGSRI